MLRLVGGVLVVAATGLVMAASAWGAFVQVEAIQDPVEVCSSTTWVSFVAFPGEVNRVALAEADVNVDTMLGTEGPCSQLATRSANAVVNDSKSAIVPGPGCTRIVRGRATTPLGQTDAGPKGLVVCFVAAGLDYLAPNEIHLGDGDDALFLDFAATLGTSSIGLIPATITGGAGNDTLRTLNGVRDEVDCGSGADSVVADGSDQLVGCETVTRL